VSYSLIFVFRQQTAHYTKFFKYYVIVLFYDAPSLCRTELELLIKQGYRLAVEYSQEANYLTL